MARRIRSSDAERRFQRDMSADFDEKSWVIGRPDHGTRLDRFLDSRLDWLSRREVQQHVDGGDVTVEQHRDPVPLGTLPRCSLRLRKGQRVSIRVARLVRTESPEGTEPEVVFEDGHFLVMNKPAGQTVYPNGVLLRPSLVEEVHRWWKLRDEAGAVDSKWMPSPCHRLDRETSGVVVFAKDPDARALVGQALEDRRVEKTYLALACGEVASDTGTISLPIGPAPDSAVRSRQRAAKGLQSSRPARTRYRVLARERGRSLVELKPLTGRQHQLRVHMAAVGHPLVGDKLYLGGDDLFLRSIEDRLTDEDLGRLGHARQALHAWRFCFEAPLSGDRALGTDTQDRQLFVFEAPLPEDLADLFPQPSAVDGGQPGTSPRRAPERGSGPAGISPAAGR